MNNIKADTAVIRKLMISLASMGHFDQLVKIQLGSVDSARRPIDMHAVRYKNPSVADAERLFKIGVAYTPLPGFSDFDSGSWQLRTQQGRILHMRNEAIDLAMRMLHDHIQKTNKEEATI